MNGLMLMKRINIITGHYGSGKTEFAINYAMKLKEEFGSAVICDMDIVNPYFRTNDAKAFLEKNGIKVIAPQWAGTNLDIPSLPSDILSVFSDKNTPAVLDVGGDDDGAIALGQYYPYLKDEDYDMFMVVNAMRPDTSSAKPVIELARSIELSSRCRINAIVNNTNLSYLSSPDDVINSASLIDDICGKMNVELRFISATKENLSKLPESLESKKFPLELYMQLPFDAFA